MNERLRQLACPLAAIALGHVARENTRMLQVHVMTGPDDIARPIERHPIFYGSFDWHSCVHGHWLLARILGLFPEIEQGRAIRDHFDQAFTEEKVAKEVAYFKRPASRGFERPYGWAWLLKLSVELRLLDGPWAETLRPLAEVVADRFRSYLPLAEYPIRAGVHTNTAFALALALDFARGADEDILALIEARAHAWYDSDADCQAWEPAGDDFLSPALMEAELMRRVLAPDEFRVWFSKFLPDAANGRPAALFSAARVSDRSDGKIAHLDGLNLSRAWCWSSIAKALDESDPVRVRAEAAAEAHLEAGLSHLAADYMGEHWLASFAMLAVGAEPACGQELATRQQRHEVESPVRLGGAKRLGCFTASHSYSCTYAANPKSQQGPSHRLGHCHGAEGEIGAVIAIRAANSASWVGERTSAYKCRLKVGNRRIRRSHARVRVEYHGVEVIVPHSSKPIV